MNMTIPQRYSISMRTLHWLIFVVATIGVIAVEIHGAFPKGSVWRGLSVRIHESLGVVVLALMLARVAVRLTSTFPPSVPGPPILRWAATATHIILIALLIGMPLLGMLALAYGGDPISVFGWHLTIPVRRDDSISDTLMSLYEDGATLVFIFVGLHAAAALWHQFILKDKLLDRMR